MEFEFDKEIDAILRKARENEAVFAANVSESHLDADVLSAFAENALPEKSKKLYTAHLADCDRCRRILSNLISLNAEEESVPVKIAETSIIETAVPWYRKLFFGRNLVYTMGALVLAFSAFTGYIVIQNVSNGLSSEVSMANTASKPVRGPSASDESVSPSNSASVANTASNMSAVPTNPAAANANASSMNTATTSATPMISGIAKDNDSLAKAPEPIDRNKSSEDVVSGGVKPIDLPSQPRKEESRDLKNENPKPALAQPKIDDREERKTVPAPPPVAAAERDEQQDKMVTRSTTNPSPAGAAKMAKKKADSKTVNGKTFNYENSVWVDSQYRQGMPLTNISRGSNEYQKLDGGLKNIAQQFNGTVVVVWKSKAYQIR
ncbi:MAG: zf-HC2 domain-containing protein [Pyrinomonadaceae bacterium]|nr:zf-HC2 domain-containing protein [Pyrinomonadaceae bacterium]